MSEPERLSLFEPVEEQPWREPLPSRDHGDLDEFDDVNTDFWRMILDDFYNY